MSRWGRLRLATRERLPLWWRTRCGVEPRTLAALAVVLLVVAGFAVHHFWAGRPETVDAPAAVRPAGPAAAPPPGAGAAEGARRPLPASVSGPAAGVAPTGEGTSGGRSVVVDVSGKVHDPGVHRLPPGSRVADALRAAGGVRHGTDVSGLNRARVLTDGEQIVVGTTTGPPTAGQPAGPVGGPGAAAPGGPAADVPVSLSTATAEQLDTLPGVGPVLAQHILDYRVEHGGFRSVDELRDVHGIGDRRFAELRPLVRP